MTSTNFTNSAGDLRGRDVCGPDGEKIGTLGQMYSSDPSESPTWASVRTGLFGMKESMVPLTGASMRGDTIQVAFDKATVKDAPNVDNDADEPLSDDQVRDLYRYYNLGWDEQSTNRYAQGYTAGTEHSRQAYQAGSTAGVTDADTSTTGDWADDRTAGRTGDRDDAMTRSEEQLNVDTRAERTGTARLRKYVVTENVQTTVPVQREEVRLEREPITDANRDSALSGPDLTESEHEVTLHAEQPVVQKETVPVERVSLGKQTVTDEQTVSEDVSKERIEADLPDQERRHLD
jgi:uncharacterized protein (TIGR02271 family)